MVAIRNGEVFDITPAAPTTRDLCEAVDGWVSDTTDCGPRDGQIHPDATEDCTDTIDNDCDELVDAEDPECVDT